jgi:hypothetical protein
MAVIQISKIQQRRGQKLQSGIPQLSSGELAWAVDTQELFIGNGSLLEGAPYVGNTRILTEHDNILELSSSYRFANDDVSITFSTSRSLQSKLDEVQVSILDFGQGILADGSTDCTDTFEIAFAELFQNTNQQFRKVLIVPNGRYIFSRPLIIPSNVILRGETRDGVILDVGANGIVFASADNSLEVEFTGSNRPENISISNLTIYSEGGETDITGLKSSVFENVKFISDYKIGDNILEAVTPFVEYDISRISTGGNVTISVTPAGSTYLTETITILFDQNSAGTIDDIVAEINPRPEFNSKFLASRESEFLIIEPINPEEFTAADISTFFAITINNIDGSELAGQRLVESSSGIENVKALVSWRNELFDTRVNEVTFNECLFQEGDLSVKCLTRLRPGERYQTSILFNKCKFFINDTAIYVESPAGQVNDWQLLDCQFEEIFRNAVYSTNGTGITITRPIVKNCGNGISSAANPLYPIFVFEGNEKYGNVLVDVISDRHQAAGIVTSIDALAVPEAKNAGVVVLSNDHYSEIEPNDAFTSVAVYSSHNRYTEIDYILTLETGFTRKGKLMLVVNDQMTEVAVSDSYIYSSDLITTNGGTQMTNFEFDAVLRSNKTPSDSQNDTVVLRYKNPQNLYGSLSYTLTYGV